MTYKDLRHKLNLQNSRILMSVQRQLNKLMGKKENSEVKLKNYGKSIYI